jgi:hypothetical protein
MVRKQSLTIQVDGKDFYSWKPEWKRVSVHSLQSIKAREKLFLVLCVGTWKVTAATLTPARY